MGFITQGMPTYFTSEAARDNYRKGLITQLGEDLKRPEASGHSGDNALAASRIVFAGKVPIVPQAPSQAAPVRETNAGEISNSSKKRQLIKANRSVNT